MGGMGSGRTGGNPTSEATGSFILSVKGLLGRFPWSAVGFGTVTFRSRWYGEFPVEVHVSTTDRATPYSRGGRAGRRRPRGQRPVSGVAQPRKPSSSTRA